MRVDRNRDRQSRPRIRLSRFSRRADRCRDRALPRHPRASHIRRAHAGALGRRAPRKHDPGEKFPWARLAASGVGCGSNPAPLYSRHDAQARDEAFDEFRTDLVGFAWRIRLGRGDSDPPRAARSNPVHCIDGHFQHADRRRRASRHERRRSRALSPSANSTGCSRQSADVKARRRGRWSPSRPRAAESSDGPRRFPP